ncbi:MAG: UbiA family prenyltransferase [Polyangiaceae bacterium]
MSSAVRFSRALIKQLRLHQWAKNALVLVPALLAPGRPRLDLIGRGLLAALAFSLAASAGYVLNDLLDLEADRAHPTKRNRPFASGALPPRLGPPLGIALVAAAFGIALAFLPKFIIMLGLYLVGTVAYSLWLKRLLLVDVLVLAGLYAHRVLSGGVATQVHVSAWLFGFSIFLFTSLAFAKRYVELRGLTGDEPVKNRAYVRVDLDMVRSMGVSSGFLSVLVFMLYVEGPAGRAGYAEPAVLWLALPVLLYWLGRVWLLTGRGQMQDDPVRFALRDGRSIAAGLVIVGLAAVARFPPSWVVTFLHG